MFQLQIFLYLFQGVAPILDSVESILAFIQIKKSSNCKLQFISFFFKWKNIKMIYSISTIIQEDKKNNTNS